MTRREMAEGAVANWERETMGTATLVGLTDADREALVKAVEDVLGWYAAAERERCAVLLDHDARAWRAAVEQGRLGDPERHERFLRHAEILEQNAKAIRALKED